jgi:hypothetical protein
LDYITRMQSEALLESRSSSSPTRTSTCTQLDAISEGENEDIIISTQISTSPGKKRKSQSLLSFTSSDEKIHSSSSPASPGSPKRHNSGAGAGAGAVQEVVVTSTSQINKHWREKICEWAYQGKIHYMIHLRCWIGIESSSCRLQSFFFICLDLHFFNDIIYC